MGGAEEILRRWGLEKAADLGVEVTVVAVSDLGALVEKHVSMVENQDDDLIWDASKTLSRIFPASSTHLHTTCVRSIWYRSRQISSSDQFGAAIPAYPVDSS